MTPERVDCGFGGLPLLWDADTGAKRVYGAHSEILYAREAGRGGYLHALESRGHRRRKRCASSDVLRVWGAELETHHRTEFRNLLMLQVIA
jgi:hypothetical protein